MWSNIPISIPPYIEHYEIKVGYCSLCASTYIKVRVCMFFAIQSRFRLFFSFFCFFGCFLLVHRFVVAIHMPTFYLIIFNDSFNFNVDSCSARSQFCLFDGKLQAGSHTIFGRILSHLHKLPTLRLCLHLSIYLSIALSIHTNVCVFLCLFLLLFFVTLHPVFPPASHFVAFISVPLSLFQWRSLLNFSPHQLLGVCVHTFQIHKAEGARKFFMWIGFDIIFHNLKSESTFRTVHNSQSLVPPPWKWIETNDDVHTIKCSLYLLFIWIERLDPPSPTQSRE